MKKETSSANWINLPPKKRNASKGTKSSSAQSRLEKANREYEDLNTNEGAIRCVKNALI